MQWEKYVIFKYSELVVKYHFWLQDNNKPCVYKGFQALSIQDNVFISDKYPRQHKIDCTTDCDPTTNKKTTNTKQRAKQASNKNYLDQIVSLPALDTLF